jgi:O-acetyl-ADP-ribose deacetylase (regulator of RNase III)
MLRYVTINLFESPAQTLVNTVNTAGVMGKGVAHTFKRLYPDMYERYRAFCEAGRFDIGQLYLYKTPNKWVLNFPTKQHWRNPSRLDWIETGLDKFVRTYAERGITSVSFPQLGTGNGGLPWGDVQPLMDKYLRGLSIPVFIHTSGAPADFVPEHLDAEEVRRLRAEYQTAREHVSFDDFMNDLSTALRATRILSEDSPDGVPGLTVHTADEIRWDISGEDLSDLWQSLVNRRALQPQDFPRRLQDHAAELIPQLLALPYIGPVYFTKDGKTASGIRFAPQARTESVLPIELRAEG